MEAVQVHDEEREEFAPRRVGVGKRPQNPQLHGDEPALLGLISDDTMVNVDAVSIMVARLEAEFKAHIREEEHERLRIARTLESIDETLKHVPILMERGSVIQTELNAIKPELEAIKQLRAKLAAVAVFATGVLTLVLEGAKYLLHITHK